MALSVVNEAREVPQLRTDPAIFLDGNGAVSSGEKEMIAAVMGMYAYEPRIPLQARYVEFLIVTVIAFLVKEGKYQRYAVQIADLGKFFLEYCNKLHLPAQHDICRAMKFQMELVLRAIIEKEGYSANNREAYSGRTEIPADMLEGSVPGG